MGYSRSVFPVLLGALLLAARFSGAAPVTASTMTHNVVEQSKVAGLYRIVLVLLPTEPFVTARQLRKNKDATGMLIVGGGVPVLPHDRTHPNHHLVVHVFDEASGKAVTGAHVKLTFVAEAARGVVERMQVVEMQAAGKGPQSTHYGNNLRIKPGTYDVTVTVNARATATFVIKPV
jgi:5-hydroxyisourate hydrolase-like protein (transthyretin family)